LRWVVSSHSVLTFISFLIARVNRIETLVLLPPAIELTKESYNGYI
jgi:hypothetical protein